jgi:hypothetical protein
VEVLIKKGKIVIQSFAKFLPLTNYQRPRSIFQARKITSKYLENPLSVCNVQVFQNDDTGIYLSLFVRHYLQLGFLVIVFDKFGYHESFIEEYRISRMFMYYPFTPLQILLDESRPQNISTARKFYYVNPNDVSLPPKTGGLHDSKEIDTDKMLGYDLARLLFDSVSSGMLFVDSDEYIYCPVAGKMYSDQEEFLARQIHATLLEHDHPDEIIYRRVAYGAVGANHSTKKYHYPLETEVISKCMTSAFKIRNHSAAMKCWTGYGAAYKHYEDSMTRSKSFEFKGRCPFHGIHYSCNYCWCNGMCNTNVMMQTMDCHIIHLNNHNYYKHVARRKSLSTFLHESDYLPLMELI